MRQWDARAGNERRHPDHRLESIGPADGDFVSRQYLVTRWDEDNCRPQCVGCNLWGRGQLLDFEENLTNELGKEKVEALKESRHLILKLDVNCNLQ